MHGEDTSLIAVRQTCWRIDPRLQRQIDSSYRPIVMAIPGGRARPARRGRQRYIAEPDPARDRLHITFGAERPRRQPS
jgi:hypothetical protein